MDNVNETLRLSLKQEIKTLNEVIESISHVSGECAEIRSWLFPTKPHQYVNELIYQDGVSTYDDFGSILELIIDRLYVGTRLILECVETKSQRKIKGSKFIHRPKQLTLGFTFQSLWKTVSFFLGQSMSNLNKETASKEDIISGTVLNRGSQTDIIALNKCDSCSSAMLCMKNLLQTFQDDKHGIRYSEKSLRPQIYDITQFGCMLQTTTSIENSLSVLFEKLFVKEEENGALQRENQKLRGDITDKFGNISLLEREVNILKDKYEKGAFKIALLNSQNEDLLQTKSKQELQLKTLEGIIKNLNLSIKSYMQNIQKANEDKEVLSYYCDGVAKKQTTFIKMISLLHNRLSMMENEHSIFKNTLMQTEVIIQGISNKLNMIAEACGAVAMKIGNIRDDMEKNSSFIVAKCGGFKEVAKRYILDLEVAKSTVPEAANVPGFQVRGNPLEDLPKQIQENNEKIKQLELENAKLGNIICKFKSFSGQK